MDIFFATKNRSKTAEFEHFCTARLQNTVSTVHTRLSPKFVEMPDIDETEDTFIGNALLKAIGTAQWLRKNTDLAPNTIVIADDSGLCVDVLGGAPGVSSARWAGPNATAHLNNLKLAEELSARNLRTTPAEVVCTLAYCRVDEQPLHNLITEHHKTNTGTCNGDVHMKGQGPSGFGFDRHFVPLGSKKTFAEMTWQEKLSYSHRGKAFELMRNFLLFL